MDRLYFPWKNKFIQIRSFKGKISLKFHCFLTLIKKISAFSGGTFTLETPFYYPSRKGYGYYLEGKLSLIDQVNEWYYDSATTTLYLQ